MDFILGYFDSLMDIYILGYFIHFFRYFIQVTRCYPTFDINTQSLAPYGLDENVQFQSSMTEMRAYTGNYATYPAGG
jgi:hypothetical protein